MAELQVERGSANANRLRGFVSVVNLGVNVPLIVLAVRGGLSASGPAPFFLSGGAGLSIAAVGAVLAITPLLFKPHWMTVAPEQDDFRKRNFAPVASLGVTPVGSNWEPTLQLAWKF